MKTKHKILTALVCLGVGAMSCSDKDADSGAYPLTLDQTSVKGKIGDTIQTTVSFSGSEITKMKVTKYFFGNQPDDTYQLEVNINAPTYLFRQEITTSDAVASFVMYTFTGYSSSGVQVDASDLLVTVSLAGVPLITRYDWKFVDELWDGEPILSDADKKAYGDNIFRLNEDYSWQFDWGAAPYNFEDFKSYCAWKIVGTEAKVDSIIFISFPFANPNVATYDAWKVDRLEGQDLWISQTFDFFGSMISAQRKYSAQPKSPDFIPCGGNWGTCNPGSY